MADAARPLIVFDLDGTLIDSRRDLADSTNEMLESYGARTLPMDQVIAMVGDGARMLVRRALAATASGVSEDEALARFRASYDRRLLRYTTLYEGVADAVRHCASRAVTAVLTNKPEEPSRRILDGLGLLHVMRWLIGGDSSFERKPDPSGLLELMTRAGTPPEETVLVGDSRIDLETGRRAGVRVCVARYGFGGLGADELRSAAWVINRPAELMAVLDRSFPCKVRGVTSP
jgi:phosphoglycolate phosphatase